MIIETSANQFYRVTDHTDPDLSHVWLGVAVKKVRGIWEPKRSKGVIREVLVRKEASRVVEAA